MKKHNMKSGLVLAMVIAVPLLAQTVGMPVGQYAANDWSISVSGTYLTHENDLETAVSKRALVKSIWAAAPWFDVFLSLGGAQLDMKLNESEVEDYHGKYTFAYGAGFNLNLGLSASGKTGFLLGGQVLRFPSEGSFINVFEAMNDFYYREYAMEYDWREFLGHAAFVTAVSSVKLYAAGVAWAVQRLDDRTEYLVFGEEVSYMGKEKTEYQSGWRMGGLAGIEFALPGRFGIHVEVLYFDQFNYQLMLGISQRGMDPW